MEKQAVKKRIAWVDIAKLFCMLSIIALHTVPYKWHIFTFTDSFATPLFFILSGFTFRPAEDWKTFIRHIKKSFLHLVVPAVLLVLFGDIWNIVNDLPGCRSLWDVVRQLFWFSGWDLHFNEGGILNGTVTGTWTLWFLTALFIAKTVIDLVNILFKSKDNFMLIFLLGFVGVMCGKMGRELPLSLDLGLASMIWVEVGQLYKKYYDKIERFAAPIFFAAFVFWFYISWHELHMDISARSYQMMPVTMLQNLAGAFVVSKISQILETCAPLSRVLAYLGRNTMLIFTIHTLDYMWVTTWNVAIWHEPALVSVTRRLAVIGLVFIFVKLFEFLVSNLKLLKAKPRTV